MDRYEEMAERFRIANHAEMKYPTIAAWLAAAMRFADSECEKKTCEWGEVMDAVPTCINPTGKVVVCRRIVEVKK